LTKRVPIITLAPVLLSIVVFYRPDLFERFVYNRQAVLNGEIWRIFSAPLAHFSTRQLFWDLLVFSAFGYALENLSRRILLAILVLTAVFSGVIYLIFLPDLAYYGGLSGIATGIVAYLCLRQITALEDKGLWVVILALLIIKITLEMVLARPLFAWDQNPGFALLPSAHLVGLGVASFVWIRPKKIPQVNHVFDKLS
jgi:rhomboid family GlyGly-CTERM serine protease